jgi:hypothetical protein
MNTNVTTSEKNVLNASTTEKKVLNLNTKENQKKYLDAKKDSIKNDTKIENLDFITLKNSVSKIKVVEKNTKGNRNKMYKFEYSNLSKQQTKSLRTKARNERNIFLNNLILNFQKDNISECKKIVKEFKDFYIKTYVLNDYSVISLSNNNRDKDTTILIETFLKVFNYINTLK